MEGKDIIARNAEGQVFANMEGKDITARNVADRHYANLHGVRNLAIKNTKAIAFSVMFICFLKKQLQEIIKPRKRKLSIKYWNIFLAFHG